MLSPFKISATLRFVQYSSNSSLFEKSFFSFETFHTSFRIARAVAHLFPVILKRFIAKYTTSFSDVSMAALRAASKPLSVSMGKRCRRFLCLLRSNPKRFCLNPMSPLLCRRRSARLYLEISLRFSSSSKLKRRIFSIFIMSERPVGPGSPLRR